jgi:hypothetical protein
LVERKGSEDLALQYQSDRQQEDHPSRYEGRGNQQWKKEERCKRDLGAEQSFANRQSGNRDGAKRQDYQAGSGRDWVGEVD